jgi:hypothetical protein
MSLWLKKPKKINFYIKSRTRWRPIIGEFTIKDIYSPCILLREILEQIKKRDIEYTEDGIYYLIPKNWENNIVEWFNGHRNNERRAGVGIPEEESADKKRIYRENDHFMLTVWRLNDHLSKAIYDRRDRPKEKILESKDRNFLKVLSTIHIEPKSN